MPYTFEGFTPHYIPRSKPEPYTGPKIVSNYGVSRDVQRYDKGTWKGWRSITGETFKGKDFPC